jgi:hypothetical protein
MELQHKSISETANLGTQLIVLALGFIPLNLAYAFGQESTRILHWNNLR